MATLSNTNDNTIISGTNEADSLNNIGSSNVTIYGYNGNDIISDYQDYNGSYIIDNHNVIFAGDDDNLVTSSSNNSTINADSGNDTIAVTGNNDTIDAGNGDNLISSYTGNIVSGNGNDTIYSAFNISGNSFINAGDGNNSIHCAIGSLTPSSTVVGNATIIAGNGNDSISATYLYDSSIYSGGGDDYIISAADTNLTINAGTGNDSIDLPPIIFAYSENPTTLKSKDFILYSEGDGNDTINGYSANDTIQINSTSTPSTVASGSDLIINVSEGSIRLVNATDTSITAINSSGDAINFAESSTAPTVSPVNTDTTVASGWATIISSEGTNIISDSVNNANGTDNAETIQTASISNTVRAVFGNGGDDLIIIGGSSNGIVTLEGGEGADTISVSSIDSLSGVSIVAGAGDNISVGNGSAKFIFDSTNPVTINGATFAASTAGISADLVSYAEGTSIGSDWNGTVALSGTNSLADVDGNIVSGAGSYQVVDGKLAGNVEPAQNPVVNPNGKKYDVVFLIDNTGSMSDYIESVQSAVSSFTQTLQNSGLNCRYGLVEYGDINDSNINVYDFTTDTSTFISNVNNINLTGGGDLPESGLEAIVDGAFTMNFDEDAEKRFIVITDADFHNSDESGDGNSALYLSSQDVSRQLTENGVIMDVVGTAGDCQTEWEPLANNTGGKFYLLGEDFPSIFANIAMNMVNIINLGTVPDEQTGYFVSSITSPDGNTFTTPLFQTNVAGENEITAGNVDEVKVYVADSDTSYAQNILITDGWNVTATENDDVIMVNGDNVTVAGGAGSDIFNLGSDVKTVSLTDLNPAEDKLSFTNFIEPGFLNQSSADGYLVLSADDLRLELPAMSEMTDEFLDYSVSNAGTSATIRELLYSEGRTIISFAQWKFGFNSPSSETFSFF